MLATTAVHRAARRHLPDDPLDVQQPAVFARVRVGERAVARRAPARACGRRRAPRAARARRRARSTAPCGCPRRSAAGSARRSRRRRTRRPRPRGAAGGGSSCPGSRRGGRPRSRGEPHGRLLDVVRGPERADADAHLVAGGEAPAVAGADVARVDPQLHLLAAARRVHLEAAREPRVRRLDRRRVGEHAPPAERVDDQRRAQLAAVGVHGVARSRPVTVAVSNSSSARLRLRPQQRAQLAVVERRERPRQLPARGRDSGVCTTSSSKLWRCEPIRSSASQPVRRHRAGRGLALADLVAVDHQHARAASRRARARPPGRRSSRRRRARRSRAPGGFAALPASSLGQASAPQ